jgi:deoxyxylulose-5-phosphate synthase
MVPSVRTCFIGISGQPKVYLIDFAFVKPLDEKSYTIFKTFKRIITLEDGTIIGGW